MSTKLVTKSKKRLDDINSPYEIHLIEQMN